MLAEVKTARMSGILAHVSSLPDDYGIGSFSAHACRFIEQLAQAEQNVWQVLPLHDTLGLASPYSACSTYALNPLLMDVQGLLDDGLLRTDAVASLTELPHDYVDFAPLMATKRDLCFQAGGALAGQPNHALYGPFQAYMRKHGKAWLLDYALFLALKKQFDGAPWPDWPAEYAQRQPQAMRQARTKLASEIEAHCAVQFLAEHQWQKVRGHAHAHDIAILGDMAIFLGHDSAEVWANPTLFKLDADFHAAKQAGVPPDYFSETGQHWGNPIYDWDAHAADGFQFWISRVGRLNQLVDGVRIDHFRGFAACWEIPRGAPDARSGAWVAAPGVALFEAVMDAMPDTWIVAEDLGLIDDDVRALKAHFGFPGMRVLQFSLGGPIDELVNPVDDPINSLCCTGTHDNDTILGWLAQASPQELENVAALIGPISADMADAHWRMIELAMRSNANLVITPLQDVLGLGAEARMNVPGTIAGNWSWRYRDGILDETTLAQLCHLTRQTRRVIGA